MKKGTEVTKGERRGESMPEGNMKYPREAKRTKPSAGAKHLEYWFGVGLPDLAT